MHSAIKKMNYKKSFAYNKSLMVRLISAAAMAIIVLVGVIPLHSNAAGGLVICGSDQGETTLATAVNSPTNAGSQTSLTAFNNSSNPNASCQISELIPQIVHVINWLIASAGLFAVVWIIAIGLQMVIFSGDAGKVKKLKEDLMSVIIGLVLVMLAFVLINTIYDIFQIQINGTASHANFNFNPFNN